MYAKVTGNSRMNYGDQELMDQEEAEREATMVTSTTIRDQRWR